MRQVCVEIPDEDLTVTDRQADNVGHLQMSLYGTRDAAMNRQEEVAKEMRRLGVVRGRYNPCLYWHERLKLTTMVHGDGFVTVGTRKSAQEFRRMLEKRFEIKTQVFGCADSLHGSVGDISNTTGEVQEGRVLNRILRWSKEGWEIEPDQRHADIIVHELKLDEARAVGTPGQPEAKWEQDENAVPLSAEDASR